VELFGPIIYSLGSVRGAFVQELLDLIDINGSSRNAIVWLWRRLPHSDTLVLGGPEIDFGIQTDDVFLLGEAKWRSSVGTGQGVHRNKDQMALRKEFCRKYGSKLLGGIGRFVVLGVSRKGESRSTRTTRPTALSFTFEMSVGSQCRKFETTLVATKYGSTYSGKHGIQAQNDHGS
jgi:hypothetical protein